MGQLYCPGVLLVGEFVLDRYCYDSGLCSFELVFGALLACACFVCAVLQKETMASFFGGGGFICRCRSMAGCSLYGV